MQMKRWIRLLGRWLLAVLATTVLGSIAQTQFNLAALAAMGQSIGLELRLQTTLLDLARFAPLLAAAGCIRWRAPSPCWWPCC